VPSKYPAHWAESAIATYCGPSRTTSKYIAGFKTTSGLELALDRTPKLAQLWLAVPPETIRSTAGVTHYPPAKSRNSNLRSQAKTLWVGNDAWHVKLSTPDDLDEILSWYCALADSKGSLSHRTSSHLNEGGGVLVALAKTIMRWLDLLAGRLRNLTKSR
jgi:hypothetical protein